MSELQLRIILSLTITGVLLVGFGVFYWGATEFVAVLWRTIESVLAAFDLAPSTAS